MELHNVSSASAAGSLPKRGTGISQALRGACDQLHSQEPGPPCQTLEFRRVRTPDELETVYRMTHDAYVDMGFIAPRPDGRLAHYPHLDSIPETTIVIAVLEGSIVGTASLTLDGPAGLHVDEDFKIQTNRIRAEGRRLAASYRINTPKAYRHRQDIVMGLLKEIARRALEAGVETCLFIFNKRHESIYRKLFNMKTIAELPEIRCVRNFPAVFMRCDFEDLPGFWGLRPPAAMEAQYGGF